MEMETPSWKKFKRVRNLPIWGENLPKSFLTRLSLFMELAAVQRQELVAKITQEVEDVISRQLAALHHLEKQKTSLGHEPKSKGVSNLQPGRMGGQNYDICLPAVFMPSKVGHVYHPGAGNYFHPTGISDGGGRIGQPPTLLNLPPLQLNRNYAPILNLFDLSRQNILHEGPTWLKGGLPGVRIPRYGPPGVAGGAGLAHDARNGIGKSQRNDNDGPNFQFTTDPEACNTVAANARATAVLAPNNLVSFESGSPPSPHDIPNGVPRGPDPTGASTEEDVSFSQSFGASFPKDEHPEGRGRDGDGREGGEGRGKEVEMIVGLEDVFNEGGFSLASLDNSSRKMPL